MQDKKKHPAYFGLLAAMAIIFGYVESLFPVFVGIPGIKLGIANLATLIVLYLYGAREAVLIAVIRILAIGFLFGSLFSILFSLAGAFSSLAVMWLLKRQKGFTILGISVAGGVTHNIAQVIVAGLVVENSKVLLLYYLPALLISGLAAGIVIGLLSRVVIKRILPEFRKDGYGR